MNSNDDLRMLLFLAYSILLCKHGLINNEIPNHLSASLYNRLEGKFASVYLPSFALLPTLAAKILASLAEKFGR